MAKVLVVYYSRRGATEALAKAVAEGAKREGAEVVLRRVDYATAYDLLTADAVAFGSPNYFSYMAGALKDFFDRIWWNFYYGEKVAGKPAAAFTSGAGTNDAALLSIERVIQSQFKLRKVADGVAADGARSDEPYREPSPEYIKACEKLGATLAKEAAKNKGSLKTSDSPPPLLFSLVHPQPHLYTVIGCLPKMIDIHLPLGCPLRKSV